MSNGFALVMRLLPSPVGRLPKRNTTAPLVQRHYSAFIPTTDCSAPVLRIGTRDLTGIARSISSLSIGATGSPVPCKSLIQVHAAFEPGATGAGLQVSAPTYPRMTTNPGSDPNDTISAVHRRFAFARLPGPHLTGSCPAFSATLPSRPGEFHPEPLTDPDLTLSRHPARATERRLPPSIEYRVPPIDPISKAMTHPLRSRGITPLQHYKETDSPPQLDSDDAAMTYERFIRCGSAKPVANYYEAVRP